jgi:hypothetical protein
MLTRLYLTQHIKEYKAYGLYAGDINPLKHFRLLKDFSLGFVRVYEISYAGFEPELDLGSTGNVSDSLAYTTLTEDSVIIP